MEPRWYCVAFGTMGELSEGLWQEFSTDAEYVEALREPDPATEE